MADDVHGDFDPNERWHGKGYGCIWKHEIKKGLEECDYRKNGYDISKDDRTSVYNGDHFNAAKKLKYIDANGTPSDQAASDLADARMQEFPAGKDAAWKAKWLENLKNPFGLLAVDKNAWHIDHIFDNGSTKVMPWWGSNRKLTTPKSNFLPQPHKGWHYMFPYKHTYHHLIEKDSFLTYVINAPVPSSAVTQFRRKKIVITKKYLHWNINNKNNVILLPNEVPHAEVVELPCHCPWDTCSHPKYSSILKTKLEKVKKKIDAAVEDGDHPKIKDAEKILTNTQDELYTEVKDIKGPL